MIDNRPTRRPVGPPPSSLRHPAGPPPSSFKRPVGPPPTSFRRPVGPPPSSFRHVSPAPDKAAVLAPRMRAANSAASLFASFDGDSRAFELWCAEVLAREGWDATPTPQTNDGGYDVVLRGRRGTGAVECKLYAPGRSVGRPVVQQLMGASLSIQASVVIVMTTGRFTTGAVQYAREQGVGLRDGEALAKLVDGMAGDLDDDIDFGSKTRSVEDVPAVLAGYPLDWRDGRSIWGGSGSGAKVKTKSAGLNIMLGVVVLSPLIFAFLVGALSAMAK